MEPCPVPCLLSTQFLNGTYIFSYITSVGALDTQITGICSDTNHAICSEFPLHIYRVHQAPTILAVGIKEGK